MAYMSWRNQQDSLESPRSARCNPCSTPPLLQRLVASEAGVVVARLMQSPSSRQGLLMRTSQRLVQRQQTQLPQLDSCSRR